jgi:urocanate hydratase
VQFAVDDLVPTGSCCAAAAGSRRACSERAERKIRRAFWTDPALGVVRYADAGDPEALTRADEAGLDTTARG